MPSEFSNFGRRMDALQLVLEALPSSVSKEQKDAVVKKVVDESLQGMQRELDEIQERNRQALWEMMQPPAHLNIP